MIKNEQDTSFIALYNLIISKWHFSSPCACKDKMRHISWADDETLEL